MPGEGPRRARRPDSPAQPRCGEPVALEMAGADDLKKLRQNGTGKLLLVNFWATWCAPCASEFPDLEATYRMYKARNLEFVTVSVNDPGGARRRARVPADTPRVAPQPALRDRGRLRTPGGLRPEDAGSGAVHAAARTERRRRVSGARRARHRRSCAARFSRTFPRIPSSPGSRPTGHNH